MPLTASSICDRASKIVQDTTNVRWPSSELVQWFNDGQREVVLHRPDSNPQTFPVLLAAGTRQKLTTGVTAGGVGTGVTPAKLLDVICNCTSASPPTITARGTAVRLVEREVLDSQTSGWHSVAAAGNGEIKHYAADPRDPLAFYVYPQASATSKIEVLFSAYPTDVTESGGVITGSLSIPDIFGNAILDYVLYRAYSKDSEYAGNASRAQFHYTAFANSLGIELKATMMMGPMVSGAAWNPNAPKTPAGS